MARKVNPNVQRIGITRTWESNWFALGRKYQKNLAEDIALRKEILQQLKEAGVSGVEILRRAGETILNILTARPGVIIGRQGEQIEKFKTELQKKFKTRFEINIKEIKKPDLDAHLLGESVAKQIEKRVAYRRAAKMSLERAMEAGAEGCKILVSGRLNGVEIARDEFFAKGKIPLQTFRADIDYAYVPALTTYGIIGVKVWIYRGEIFKKKKEISATTGLEVKSTPNIV